MKLEDFNEEDFCVSESIKAQRTYCTTNEAPDFAPNDGVCWKCHNQIYAPIKNSGYVSGITTEYARTKLVTGCPHCNRSYCD